MTISPAPSAAPANVRRTGITSTSITVRWGKVPCIHRNGDITGYIVQYGSQTQSVSGGSVTETTISNLTPSTTYNIQVAAVNDADTGGFSSSISIMTSGTTTATTITISWSSDDPMVTSYEVMWERDTSLKCTGFSDMDSTTITDGSTSYDITGLEEDSTYSITVTASNSAGSSAVSNTVTAMTMEAGTKR